MKKLVRLTSALLAVSLLSVLCAIPASATELSGTASVHIGFVSPSSGSFEIVNTGYSVSYSSLSEQTVGFAETQYFSTWNSCGLGSFDLNDESVFYSGSVGVYISYFISSGNILSLISSPGAPSIRYKNHLGVDGTGEGGVVKNSSFTPAGITPGPSSGYSYGQSIAAHFQGSEEYPISQLRVVGNANSMLCNMKANEKYSIYLHFPSIRVIGTESSADLEALEGIADSIAAQSDILQAMYGDIIAICNSIYQKTGDILDAQVLANSYFVDILTVLKKINKIDSNIYTLLSTQFETLISTINQSTLDIKSAIEAQTAALIAYFDSIQNVSSVPDSIQDKTHQGETIRNDMAGLNKPELTAPSPSDFFTDQEAAPFTDVLGQLFSSSLIVNLLLVAFSIAFVAYVLYGKE